MANFIWGAGGARLTPEDIAAQRKVADALMMQGMDASPVQSPWQGAARVAQALLGGLESGQADAASKQNAAHSSDLIAQALASNSAGTAAPAPIPSIAAVPSGSSSSLPGADVIRAGLIQRGIPAPVADGFVMNFKDESGLNPGINEAQPLVPGSRGGYGLAQWTGPRRVALEQFAQQSGRPVDDVNTQLDYLVNELKGPEAAAAQSFMGAQTPKDAAVAIVKNFLRPAQVNLDRRVAQYSGGAAPTSVPASGGINPAILELATSQYVSPQDRKIGALLLQNQLEAQTKANDPMRALDMQLKQGQLSALPLDRRAKELANTKAERELQGEGAKPLTADERTSYGIPTGQPAYKTRSGEIKFGPAGTKITNNVGDAESSFSKEAGKATANRFNDLVADGQQARQLMSDMNTLIDLGKGIGTGKAAQVKAVLGPFAEAAGLKVDGLSDIQAYEAIVNRVGPSLRVKGSGAQSDYELKNFLKSIPTLGNTQEGNEMAVAVMNGLQQNKVAASEIASKALAGEITRTEAEKQLRTLPDPMQPYRNYRKQRSDLENIMKKYGG
jgi:hypothetical protein